MNDLFQQYSDAPWWMPYALATAVAAVIIIGSGFMWFGRDTAPVRTDDEDDDYDLNFYRPQEEPVQWPAFRVLACGQEVPGCCVIAANDKGVPHGLDS